MLTLLSQSGMNTVDHYQPCGDPFLARPQSHIHVPAASAPQPPAEPIWSPLSGCVRPERPLLPSSPGLYTPEGMSSSKAPPAWSWNSSITDPYTNNGQEEHIHTWPHISPHRTFCTLCGHSSDMHCTPLLLRSCLLQSGSIYCCPFSTELVCSQVPVQ